MKKIALLIIILILISGVVFAEGGYLYEPPFEWKSPEIMSQGSSYTANAAGYDSLFTNPAGFRVDNGDFNLLTVQPTWTANPFTLLDDFGLNPDNLPEQVDDGEGNLVDPEIDPLSAVLNQVTSNGLGAGVQTSFGWAGRGLALASAVSVDSYFAPVDSVAAASGQVWATAAFIGGYAFQFDFLGVSFKVGADLRPMYRVKVDNIGLETASGLIPTDDSDSEENSDDDLENALSGIPLLSGTALGIDAGVQATMGWFTLGASLRDIGNTTFTYKTSKLWDVYENQSIINEEDYLGTEYKTPATLRLGASVHPYLGKFLNTLVDPIVHAEYTAYLVGDDYYEVGQWERGSALSRLDVGAEVSVLKLLKLRAGYNGGYLSAGVGIKLWFLEINGAVYAIESGDYAGDQQSMAGSLDISFRF